MPAPGFFQIFKKRLFQKAFAIQPAKIFKHLSGHSERHDIPWKVFPHGKVCGTNDGLGNFTAVDILSQKNGPVILPGIEKVKGQGRSRIMMPDFIGPDSMKYRYIVTFQ